MRTRSVLLTAIFLMSSAGAFTVEGAGSDKKDKKKDKAEDTKKAKTEIERIKDTLHYGHAEQIVLAIKRIGKLEKEDQKKVIADLKVLLTSKDPGVQRTLIDLLAKVEWNDLDKDVLVFFDSASSPVVIAVLSHCRKKNIKEVVPRINTYLKEEVDYKKLSGKIDEMFLVLTYFKDPTLVDFFMEKLKEEKTLPTYKIYIIRYYSEIKKLPEEIKEYLMSRVTDEKEDLGVRGTSAYSLGKLKYKPAGEVFNKELDKLEAIDDIDEKKKHFRYRLKLLAALTIMGDPKVKNILIEMTKSNDASTRKAAIIHLGDLGGREYIDLLEYKEKNDPSKSVRKSAEEALVKIRGEKPDSKKKDKEKEKEK
ncbi:MAG: HEAT repeat domain-containing protein [Leptospirales bacterium]